MPDQLLTIEQTAEYLNTSVRHIRELVQREAIPVTRVGRLLRFPVGDLAAWLDEGRTPSTSE